ncbi:MAG: hypothetical protein LBV62_00205 [Rickettsiales bacterium]|jgi:hypothetical protein|nr:hypothetical protein [Rickettsiales bacterium]
MGLFIPILDQIESVGNKKLEQQGYSHSTEHPKGTGTSQSSTTIYGHINEHMEENISSTLREIHEALISYNNSEHLPNNEAIENLAKRFRESIRNAKKNKGMFSVPCHIDVLQEGEKLSIIDYSILILRHLMENDANVTEAGKSNLQPFWLEMSNLVSKGNDVSTRASKVLPVDIMKKRDNYLQV